MTAIYRVAANKDLHHSDPLHVGRFYPDKQRFHRTKMRERQDLILYLANLHASSMKATRLGMPRAMCRIPIRLMSLRKWDQDYRVVLDHFFEVESLGFHIGDKYELTVLIPKKLKVQEDIEASKAADNLTYVLPPRPDDSETISKVIIQIHKGKEILDKLSRSSRIDLRAPVEWLLSQPGGEVNFHFARSGKLQQRDTSVWPVQAVETWPSWLREELFGPGVDIDSAYTQFMIQHLRDVYVNQPSMMSLMFPDLLRSLEDKKAWRKELCVDVLGLPHTDENLSTIKKLCMSLANGSRISPSILTGSRAFSVTADIVFASTDDVSLENLTAIGKRLEGIAKQYSSARKIVCLHLLEKNASRKNQKLVFSSYFEWERTARYMIWEAIGRQGIMVHDGIDGVPAEELANLPTIMKELNLRLTC